MPVVLWDWNMSFSEKNMKRIKSRNSVVTSGVFIYNISMATISPRCKGFVPIIPCLPTSNSLLNICLGFLPDMLLVSTWTSLLGWFTTVHSTWAIMVTFSTPKSLTLTSTPLQQTTPRPYPWVCLHWKLLQLWKLKHYNPLFSATSYFLVFSCPWRQLI